MMEQRFPELPQRDVVPNDLYRLDTLRVLEALGLDDPLAPNCILLVKLREKVPSFATRSGRGNHPGASGETAEIWRMTVESRDLPRLAYWAGLRSPLAENGLPTFRCQYYLGDISIN